MSPRTVEFHVTPHEEGQRLDRLLVSRIPGLGRKGATLLVRSGNVRVNGRRAVKGQLPLAGAHVSVLLPEANAMHPEARPLDVLLERPEVVVVNKPAGQPTAIVRPSDQDTLVHSLLAKYPEMAGVGFGEREPGIIHRLDTQTSGILVAARTQASFEALRRALESGDMVKRYLGIVASGAIDDAGVISDWLGPHSRNRRKVAIYPAGHHGARAARSEYRVLERFGTWALVEITASRAYRHQIRAHMAARGCPLAGDVLYGGEEAGLAGRHALHASYVSCTLASWFSFEVTAPVPSELERLLTQ